MINMGTVRGIARAARLLVLVLATMGSAAPPAAGQTLLEPFSTAQSPFYIDGAEGGLGIITRTPFNSEAYIALFQAVAGSAQKVASISSYWHYPESPAQPYGVLRLNATYLDGDGIQRDEVPIYIHGKRGICVFCEDAPGERVLRIEGTVSLNGACVAPMPMGEHVVLVLLPCP